MPVDAPAAGRLPLQIKSSRGHRIVQDNVQRGSERAAMAMEGALQPRRFGIFASFLIAGVAVSSAVSTWVTPPVVDEPAPVPAGQVLAEAAPEPLAEHVSPFDSLEIVIRRNDTLDAIFRQMELSLGDLAQLRSLPDVRKSLDLLRPGDIILLTHLDGELKSLTRRLSDTATLSVTRDEEGFAADIIENPLELQQAAMTGTIDSSLFGAVNRAGGSDALAVTLADVFKYDIDFVNEVRTGDRFAVTYEQQWQDGEFLRDGEILAAEFVNKGKTFRAVRYVMPDGSTEYFTPDGDSVRKAFLRFPVAFGRVSSGFSTARRHPILNRVRAHKGIDFAAPVGTAIKAAGSGRVVHRGVKGGYGNTVIIAHPGSVTTLYGHMSRYARGLRVGDKVKQGEVIGYVGMTGLATGPHLHYEYRVGGVHRNPATIPLPKAESIPADLREDFKAKTAPLLAELDGLGASDGTRVALAAP
jgi:murein DD-endopeptidase MepM/ murein hydrolase activator NlpD